MTPATFKSIRQRAGLTQRGLADRVRVGARHIRYIESGEREISGPIQVLMEQIDAALNGDTSNVTE